MSIKKFMSINSGFAPIDAILKELNISDWEELLKVESKRGIDGIWYIKGDKTHNGYFFTLQDKALELKLLMGIEYKPSLIFGYVHFYYCSDYDVDEMVENGNIELIEL